MFTNALKTVLSLLERVIALLLVLLVVLAIVGLVVDVVATLSHHYYVDVDDLLRLIEHVLMVFILVELFSIALAYIQGRRVVRTVFEASLVAVVRKIIAFETVDHALEKGLALAAVTLAVSVSWFLLRRVGLAEEQDDR